LTASLLLSWREGVSAEADGDESLRVQGRGCRVVLRRLAPAAATALCRLAPPGEPEDRLADFVQGAAGAAALARWYYSVQGLARRGLVCRAVQADGRRLATLLPTAAAFPFAPAIAPLPDRPHVLSRFAYLRREGDGLVLESPLAHARVVLDDAGSAALLWGLTTPATARELAGRRGALPAEAVPLVLALLAGAGMLQEVGPAAAADDGEPAALRSWEFHDLLFHARSRKGRSDAPYGGTYRMLGRLEPPAALGPAGTGEACDLHRPDLERLRGADPPFAEVLERRRSLRSYGPRPLTARQLGEFLYRVARVKDHGEVEAPTPRGPVRLTFASRPFPAGGGLYELEFYAAVNACDGLPAGLYHYEPLGHRLGRVCGYTPAVDRLLADAGSSTGIAPADLQVLVVLAARFPRLAWKYASIAYALTLKHVGVVYQTMYLAATAMGLAPCAVGGGDSDLFARAAGTDYYAETSVGEFLLGSKDLSGEGNA
jgi:SagB-type dehydrogenase family enzyme